MELKETGQVGVIVARMQVPFLTESHIKMIKTVIERHQKVILILGTTSKISKSNPFSFDFRTQMVRDSINSSRLTMLPLRDQVEDSVWVKNLDNLVESYLYDKETPILYGGRDSFIPFYEKQKGIYKTVALAAEENDSGTSLRDISSHKIPSYSRETAEAMLWMVNKLID